MATTTTTTTTASSGAPMRNLKDSMKSTWPGDKKQWGFYHYLLEIFGLTLRSYNVNAPVHQKTDKMPHLPQWPQHRFIIVHTFWPIILQQAFIWFAGYNLNVFGAFALYAIAFQINGMSLVHSMSRLASQYGFLDGDKHQRDGVPDHSVPKVVNSLLMTLTLRPLMALMFSWDSTIPAMPTLWLPLELGLYSVVLDFWFYWYHRAMHDNDELWKYHRTHHLTKHPNPLLTLYADAEQEIFDIVGIPLLTWGTLKLMGLPMTFYDWWCCYQWVVFSELAGHSGVRVHMTTPTPFYFILNYFNMELIVEDHDLHHRKGWKKSHNYGKQTRVWDRIFGTCHERYESLPDNIDFENPISMPAW